MDVVCHQQHSRSPFSSPRSQYQTNEGASNHISAGHSRFGHYAAYEGRVRRPHRAHQHTYLVQASSPSVSSAPCQEPITPISDIAEHMLRRKTPNGTLAAGYDGRPVEWATRRPAAKHVARPTTTRTGNLLFRAARTERLVEDHSYHIEQPIMAWKNRQASQNWPLVIDPPQHEGKAVVSSDNHSQGHDWAASTFPTGGLDSMLYQGLSPHHSNQHANGQHIPTVMQPMWPPCLGMTSLNDSGPYGPYWPNGSFIPYRPAPLRDPRFYSGAHGQMLDGPEHPPHDPVQSHDWPHAEVVPHNFDLNARASHISPAERDPQLSDDLLRFNPKDTDSQEASSHWFGRSPLYSERQPKVSLQSTQNANRSLPSQLVNQIPQCLAGPSAIAGMTAQLNKNSASSFQFKEKVLVWAHRAYQDLLTSRQKSRRSLSNMHSQNFPHRHTNVFPKPPRQMTSKISENQHPATSHSQHLTANFHERQPVCPQRSSNYTITSPKGRFDNEGMIPSNLTGSVYEREGQPQPAFVACDSSNALSSPSANKNARMMSISVGSPGTQVHGEDRSISTAINAMEILSRLCQESGWGWTDGMLLGGCLAYGLGDYSKAMRWYNKVLSCDSNNVEAISNLAATLHSLDLRAEAEQYWLRSVKLRPSYFEAVEHLVGLYCEDHRGREAVQIIEYVERSLSQSRSFAGLDRSHESASESSLSPSISTSENSENGTPDIDRNGEFLQNCSPYASPRLGSSGYAIPSSDNGRLLSLVHGKGNMLYALGDNSGAAKAFESAILIGSGKRHHKIRGLIKQILKVFRKHTDTSQRTYREDDRIDEPILLVPEAALETAQLVFPPHGRLPGLIDVADGIAKRAAISIVSNSLLSLAKIYQDGMSASGATANGPRATSGVQEILALYYLSLSLQPSPSTANNVGILLASVQQPTTSKWNFSANKSSGPVIPGVVPGSGVALALAYYNYGLNLDSRHAHLYTNLGSLFKDIGQLNAAIKMYEKAVNCDGNFDIALANLANAVKDQGRISDAIDYYKRAVTANPDFAEAVCGLANALNSVCSWRGRGGVTNLGPVRDRWHVDEQGMLYEGRISQPSKVGWIERVVAIVDKQLHDGEDWGKGILESIDSGNLIHQISQACGWVQSNDQTLASLQKALHLWTKTPWEGAKVVRLIERATKRLGWHLYWNKYIHRLPSRNFNKTRPLLPAALAVPTAPTVLPFHTFTCPLSAKQIRRISQRNGLRISCSTMRAAWLPRQIYEPPAPPEPQLNVGYVSSDFNNHPLAHLMQSVFGFHDKRRVHAVCYATTTSDGSIHRQQIEREAPTFHDASSWSIDRLVSQIVGDGIHVLINLNGYTRGAKNEVFAARPAPVQMSFMGFAGTLGAEWCDYLLADKIAIPPQTLRPCRQNVELIDLAMDRNNDEDQKDWIYGENIIFTRDTFFCCDHRQSAPDAREPQLSWPEEQQRRWTMRKELFPDLPEDTIILGNFNQLYKIEPTTFRTWLRILSRIPNAILWLLRFPDLGETNLRQTAMLWVGAEVASRLVFTDVAPKHQHISRARICDLFLDTPECNAHTTAADVLWSGTPLLTFPRYEYKMCSRMAASILSGALPRGPRGDRARNDLIVHSDEEYEERAVELGTELVYPLHGALADMGRGKGRLAELRKLLYESRWTSALFDTRRWVRDLEGAYEIAWRKWVAGEGGDIWL